MHRLLLPAVLAFAVLAVPAQGATVTSSATTFHDPGGKGFPEVWITTRTVDVLAVPGEANRIVVSAAGGVVTVQDAGGPLGAGAGCVGAGAGAVTCDATEAQVLKLTARLGDGNDRLDLTAPGMRATVDAGPGDDAVTGTAGSELDGGEGDDTMSLPIAATLGATGVLRGGPGADTLTGSGWWDVIDGGTGTDVLDGAGGTDTLSYAGRPDAVTIDLGSPTAGAPGEADKIAGFEVGEGGDGDDVLSAPPRCS
jgi:hypothetical protein